MSNCSLTWNANLSSIPLIHHCMHIQLNIFNQLCTSPKMPPCSCYIIFIFTFCVLNKDVLDVTYNHCNHIICSNLFAAYILKACIQFQNDFFVGRLSFILWNKNKGCIRSRSLYRQIVHYLCKVMLHDSKYHIFQHIRVLEVKILFIFIME